MTIAIYGATLSPYVRKAVAFATEKGVDFELKHSFGPERDPDFAICSPFGLMPAMRDGDFTVCDSTAIITYLDAIKPEPNLIPTDAKDRARTIWFEEFGDTILSVRGGKIFLHRIVAPLFMGKPGDDAVADKTQAEELPPMLDYIERVLPPSGYLVADRLTLADIAVASPLMNLLHSNVEFDPAKWPKLAGFMERILARPSFARIFAAEKAELAALAG